MLDMQTAELEPARWDRRATAALLLIAAGACASLAWLVHPWYEAGIETNDASLYILTAKSLLAGEGYRYLGMPFTSRPPGFPLLIAPVLAWRGVDFHALNLTVALFGVAGVVLLFVFARARLGVLAAACLSAAVWLNPGYQHMCNQVMSDVPGAAFLLACLLVERWASRRPSSSRDAVLGLCIALAAYVRSIHVLLVPAVVVARALGQNRAEGGRASWGLFLRDRALVLAAVAGLALIPWSIRSAVHHPEPPVDQNFLFSYSTAMWHVDGGDPSSSLRPVAEILGRIPVRATQALSVLGGRMRSGESDALRVALGAVMVVAILVVLARRRSAAELFACAALVVLLVYFGFRDRLVLPIWIVALCACAEVLALAIGRALGPRAGRLAAATALLLLAFLDFSPRERWDEISAAHRRNEELCAGWKARLPPQARLAAPIGWHWSVYLDRPVYSLFFAVNRGRSVQAGEAVIDKYGIDTVIMCVEPPDDPALLAYFLQRYGIRERVGRGAIIRVRG